MQEQKKQVINIKLNHMQLQLIYMGQIIQLEEDGWTWYTGSSSWYYKAGVEYILGLKIEKGYIKIQPCIPKEWKEYEIKYKWKNTLYNIKVENNNKNTEVSKVYLDGLEVENNIKLEDRNTVHNIRVVM